MQKTDTYGWITLPFVPRFFAISLPIEVNFSADTEGGDLEINKLNTKNGMTKCKRGLMFGEL
jgi:hypothetical protein